VGFKYEEYLGQFHVTIDTKIDKLEQCCLNGEKNRYNLQS